MAAYISEVAIDAALMDESPASSRRSSFHSSHGGNEGCEETIGMGHMQTPSSSSYLKLPYEMEELDLGSHIHGGGLPVSGVMKDIQANMDNELTRYNA